MAAIGAVLLFESHCQAVKWTAMFYLAADDSLDYGLYRQAWEDMGELAKCAGNDQLNIVVQLDAPQGCARYLMTQGGPRIMAWLGRVNSGSDTVLADFGRWAVECYPAEKYLVVIWGHGYGWSRKSKYIGYDRYSHDQISIASGEMKRGLGSISESIGGPIDLLVLDACLMQSVEVLSETGGICRVVLGSQSPLPMDGLPYDRVFPLMSGDQTARELARDLVAACRDYYRDGPEMTVSAVDVDSLRGWSKNLKSFFDGLIAAGLTGCIDTLAVADSVIRFPPLSSFDLVGMLSLMKGRLSGPYSDAAGQLISGLPVLAAYTNSPDSSVISGISAWYPGSISGFYSSWGLYSGLEWPHTSGWDAFVFRSLGLSDTFCASPSNLRNEERSGPLYRLSWDESRDVSGIFGYQLRALHGLETVMDDRASARDTTDWYRNGFIWQQVDGSDGRYYSQGGSMTRREPVFLDTIGGLSWITTGYRGTLSLELSEDTLGPWDTVYTAAIYSDSSIQQHGLLLGQGYRWMRFRWTPESSGWVTVDDICSFKSDSQTAFPVIMGVTSQMASCNGGQPCQFQLRAIDNCGNASGWGRGVTCLPTSFSHPITWPNPGRGLIKLSFSAASRDVPRVRVFNIIGQAVSEMSLQSASNPGLSEVTEYVFSWDTKENNRRGLPNGVYIYRISAGDVTTTGKTVLIK
jgi:hypothetical protein